MRVADRDRRAPRRRRGKNADAGLGRRARAAAGWAVQIGAHTVSHPILSRMSDEQAGPRDRRVEADDPGRGAGPRRAPSPIPTASPSDYTETTMRLVREAGFDCAVTTRFGLNGPGTPALRAPPGRSLGAPPADLRAQACLVPTDPGGQLNADAVPLLPRAGAARPPHRELRRRDIRAKYKQTVFGVAWAVLQPLSLMVVFTFVFSKFAKIDSEGIPYPIFAYSALILDVVRVLRVAGHGRHDRQREPGAEDLLSRARRSCSR